MQYKEGYVLDGQFKLIEQKGRGSFGEVWLALDLNTDVEVAVKIYVAMDERGLEDFKKEFQVSFELNHSNLLHSNYLGISKEDNAPYLVMPYCPNGSAMKLAGKITEDQMWVFIRDVSNGLAYLHAQTPPIVHQDIKPDNILISKNGDYVITDFGISHKVRSIMRKASAYLNSAGSVAYMGPEKFSSDYTSVKASDIWSLGVTIYELVVGDLPFCGMGGGMLNNGADYPDLPSDFSSDLNNTMKACLAKDTWVRPTAEQLAEFAAAKVKGKTIDAPWITEQGQENEPEPKTVELDQTQNHAQTTPTSTTHTPSDDAIIPEPIKEESGSDKGNKKKLIAIISGVIAIIIIGIVVGISINSANEEKAKQEEARQKEIIAQQKNAEIIIKVDSLIKLNTKYYINADNKSEEDVMSKVSEYKNALLVCKEAYIELGGYDNHYGSEQKEKQNSLKQSVEKIKQEIDDIQQFKNQAINELEEFYSSQEELETDEIFIDAKSVINECEDCKKIIEQMPL